MVLGAAIYAIYLSGKSNLDSSIPKLDPVDMALMSGNTLKYGPWSATMEQPDFLDKTSMPCETSLKGKVGDEAINNWRKPKPITEYVPRAEFVGYGEARDETRIPLYEGSWSGWKHEDYYEGPINKLGMAISLTENARQLVLRTKQSIELGHLIKFMDNEDYELAYDIGSYAYGFTKKEKSAAAAVKWDPETKTASFHLGKNYRELLAAEAEALDVRYLNEILNTAFHEYLHLFRKKGTGEKLSEEEVEEYLAKFFEYLENREHQGTNIDVSDSYDSGTLRSARKRYHNISKISKIRAIVVKKGLLEKLVENKGIDNLEAVIAEFEREAEKLGLEGEDAKEYVADKLEKYAGEKGYEEDLTSDDYSEKEAKEIDEVTEEPEEAQDSAENE